MHYTSWDRSDRAKPVLLAEEGPEQLGVFSEHSAEVDGHFWRTEVSDLGASATLADGSIYRLAGRLGRDKRLEASLNGRGGKHTVAHGGKLVPLGVGESARAPGPLDRH